MSDENKINVLLVKTGERARPAEISTDLESMQAVVGGWIEEYMPFEDDVAIVCNEEGKMHGLDLNRAIYSNDGTLMDIVAGDFFICYAPIESENFESMPKDLMKKYEKKFRYPEHFFKENSEIKAVRFDPVLAEKEAGYER